MFIPLHRKLDLRNPPLATVALILANLAVFLFWQHNDAALEQAAVDYYLHSDLPAQELPRYRDYLRHHAEQGPAAGQSALLLQRMLADAPFMAALRDGALVTPRAPGYAQWQRQRAQFEALLQQSTAWRYGLKPAALSPAALGLHMFLHADLPHLLGNMLFLFLFGFVLEGVLGWRLLLGVYLLAGLASAGVDILVRPDSLAPGIGASGAIAGLAGVYTALFGRRRIHFFVALGVYFDYVRAPAVVLLPVWLAYEGLLQVLAPGASNRMVHIGGLLAGAAIGLGARHLLSERGHDTLEAEAKRDARNRQYTEALDLIADMELDAARRLLEELHARDPADRDVLLQLYHIARFDPSSAAYHDYTHRLLALPGSDPSTLRLAHDIYEEYIRDARPAFRFTGGDLLGLAIRFAGGGYAASAERIVAWFLQHRREHPRNAEALLALAGGFRREGDEDKHTRALELLMRLYPESPQALLVRTGTREPAGSGAA